jgi:hypothetical protein
MLGFATCLAIREPGDPLFGGQFPLLWFVVSSRHGLLWCCFRHKGRRSVRHLWMLALLLLSHIRDETFATLLL